MAMQMPTVPTVNPIEDSDLMEHIEDTALWTAIRNNRFVQLTWNQLDDSERRQIYINMFSPYLDLN